MILACSVKEQDCSRALLEAETIEDAIGIAKQCEKLEAKSLPIFVKTLDVLITEDLLVLNYGKIDVCLYSLSRLAGRGISSKEEAVFLLKFIQKQRLITDTLLTAEILKQITGVDVGYDKEFVEHYTKKDESKRKQMLREWGKAIEKKRPTR